jgi:hypothetical protein
MLLKKNLHLYLFSPGGWGGGRGVATGTHICKRAVNASKIVVRCASELIDFQKKSKSKCECPPFDS